MNQAEEYRKQATGDVVVKLKDAIKNFGEYSESYPIGFEIFDEAMKVDNKDNGGFRSGDLVIITGKPGEGKTTLAQNIALSYNKASLPSLFFSYEVMIDNLYGKFKKMGFSDDGVIFAPKNIITGNLNWIKAKIVEAKEKYFVKVIFIDHIDFLSPANEKQTDQLRMVLKNVTQQLKTLAIEQEVIIVLLAHVKKIDNREIRMEDISESAGIYQLADYVFSVARNFLPDENGVEVATNHGLIKLLKNRLTGRLPYLKFFMQDDIIEPYKDAK